MIIQAFRGESEGGQIIMTAENSAVGAYDVTLSDLTLIGSETPVKLSADCFSVYAQKYIEVTDRTTEYLTAGWYPDALLPLEASIRAGENKIAKGDNQGIWFTLAVPDNQPAGVYKGSFSLVTDGVTTALPVTVEVWDGTVSARNHLRTVFSVHRYWGNGGIVTAELDASWDMYRAYYDFLKGYRINTRYLPAALKDTEGFIREALRYAADPMVSTFVMPYIEKYDSAAKQNGIDYELHETLLRLMAEASIEHDINLFEKAVTYFALFDEAVLNKTVYMANTILGKVKVIHNKIADELQARRNGGDAAVRQEYIDDLRGMVNLFVDEYTAELTADNATYCPLVREYNTEQNRKLYDADAEKWWYTCVSPKTPYPTYHIDDYLYSSRIMSWMQYDYGVTGNLYWSTTYYRTSYGPDTLQDYYDTAMRFSGANGDGYLLYPGKPYGVYGPVGTIRLESIRDGMEDYEILYALGERYAEIARTSGIDADMGAVMHYLYNKLYSGTQVGTDSETFAATRERLAKLYVAAEKTGAVIANAEESGGKLDFTVFAPTGVTVKRGGETLSGRAVTGGSVFAVTGDRSGDVNLLSLTFEKDGRTYGAELDLGGKRTVYEGETLKAMLSVSEGSSLTLDDGTASGTGEAAVKAVLAAKSDSTPSAVFAPALTAAEITSKKMLLRVYNPSAARMRFVTYVRGSASQSVLYEANQTTLSPGWNTVEADLSRLNWKLIGTFDEFVLSVGEKGGADRTLYFSSAQFE